MAEDEDEALARRRARGEPCANEDYVLVDSAGSKRTGKLDSNGEVYIPPILPPGDCTIQFPNIHLNPRKRKSA